MNNPHKIGIASLAYTLPRQKYKIDDSAVTDLSSSAALLQDFGFANYYKVADQGEFQEMLSCSARAVVEGKNIGNDDIVALILYAGLARPYAKPPTSTLGLFRYESSRLAHELGLSDIQSFSLTEQGCSGFMTSIDLGIEMLNSSDRSSILCVAGDMLPAGYGREIMYNVISDSTGAIRLQKNSPKNTIIDIYHYQHAYYWDTPAREAELLAAYFPLAERTIKTALEKAGLALSDIRWIIPHNVSLRSWKILGGLLNIDSEKVWTKNIGRIGHTISCDHIINLQDMETEGALKKGDLLLLFTFGFGAQWSCLIIKH